MSRAVLDASALLAVMLDEPGAEVVEAHFEGAVISAVNLAEVGAKMIERGATPELIEAAQRDLDEFIRILEAEGVTVRRPAPVDFAQPLSTPDVTVASSCYALMPRDVLLVIGDQIIEAPMGMRSRYHENHAYKHAAELMRLGDFTIWATTETSHFERTLERLSERVLENLRRLLDAAPVDLYRICGPIIPAARRSRTRHRALTPSSRRTRGSSRDRPAPRRRR